MNQTSSKSGANDCPRFLDFLDSTVSDVADHNEMLAAIGPALQKRDALSFIYNPPPVPGTDSDPRRYPNTFKPEDFGFTPLGFGKWANWRKPYTQPPAKESLFIQRLHGDIVTYRILWCWSGDSMPLYEGAIFDDQFAAQLFKGLAAHYDDIEDLLDSTHA